MSRGRALLDGLVPWQKEVRALGARFNVLCAPRRAGKTHLTLIMALGCAFRGGTVCHVSSTWNRAKKMFRVLKALRVEGLTYRDGEMIAYTPGVGSIEFKTAGEPRSLRGDGYHLVICDEVAYYEYPEELWESVLFPTLSRTKGRAFFTSTPDEPYSYFHKLFLRGKEGEQDWKTFHYSAYDLSEQLPEVFGPDRIEEYQRTMGRTRFRREYGSEFIAAEGALIDPEWIRVSTPPETSKLWAVGGLDLAFGTKNHHDYTALSICGLDPKIGRVWWLDAFRWKLPAHETIPKVVELCRNHGLDHLVVESVQAQQSIAQSIALEIRKARLSTKLCPITPFKGKRERAQGIERDYGNGVIHHAPSLPPWATSQLLSFTGEDGGDDDAVDALVYAHATYCQQRPRDTTALMDNLKLAAPFG